jgi:hypothetical protein
MTLALCMLVTVLYLAPQPARAEEAAPFDLAKAIRDAKTSAEHEVIASYCGRAATAAYAKVAEYDKIAEKYRALSVSPRVQTRSWENYYWQQAQRSKSLAADYSACAEAQRQQAQELAQKPH